MAPYPIAFAGRPSLLRSCHCAHAANEPSHDHQTPSHDTPRIGSVPFLRSCHDHSPRVGLPAPLTTRWLHAYHDILVSGIRPHLARPTTHAQPRIGSIPFIQARRDPLRRSATAAVTAPEVRQIRVPLCRACRGAKSAVLD